MMTACSGIGLTEVDEWEVSVLKQRDHFSDWLDIRYHEFSSFFENVIKCKSYQICIACWIKLSRLLRTVGDCCSRSYDSPCFLASKIDFFFASMLRKVVLEKSKTTQYSSRLQHVRQPFLLFGKPRNSCSCSYPWRMLLYSCISCSSFDGKKRAPLFSINCIAGATALVQ